MHFHFLALRSVHSILVILDNPFLYQNNENDEIKYRHAAYDKVNDYIPLLIVSNNEDKYLVFFRVHILG